MSAEFVALGAGWAVLCAYVVVLRDRVRRLEGLVAENDEVIRHVANVGSSGNTRCSLRRSCRTAMMID